ncbi:zinc finger protein 407 isoform 2-T2 [Thomomys bottae]
MMDSEIKPADDEDICGNKEAEELRSLLSCGSSRGLVSNVTAISSENITSKRGFSDSLDVGGTIVQEGRNEHASKRMRVEETDCLDSSGQGTSGFSTPASSATEADIPSEEVGKEPFPKDWPEGGTTLPPASTSSCGMSTMDALSLKRDMARRSGHEMVSLDPKRDTSFPPEDTSVSCTFRNIDTVFKCSECGHLFPSCSDLEKHAECHMQQAKEHASCNCGHKAESSPACQAHMRNVHAAQNVFSCDLCGFQCGEENLLNAHYLSKTHLRRQNLAARGGFVQILTKQPFPKRTCGMITKNTQTRPRASKTIAKNVASKGLQYSGNEFTACGENVSQHSGSNTEVLVEMEPPRNTSSEKAKVVENVISLSIAQHSENESKKLGGLVTLEGPVGKSESTLGTMRTAHGTGTTSRPRPERSILTLGSGFRRRSGTFALKGQAKKRFNLLGISKRGTNEAQRVYTKHFRTQIKTNDAEPVLKHAEMNNSVQSLCMTSSDLLESTQDKAGSFLLRSVPLNSPAEKPASDHQKSCTCTLCGQAAANVSDLEIHVKMCHAEEVEHSHQACDLPSISRGDLEEHSHETLHQQTASVLTCQCCSFISSSELNLRDHMKEKHDMDFLCTACNLFFSEKDVEEHKATAKHVSLLVQVKTSPLLTNECVLQTLPVRTSESENLKGSMNAPARTAQEEPMKSRVSHGSELRHSSKPQFQCKKCFYKTRSSTVLTRHIKLRHGQDYHFLCKACNLYSLSKEGMEKHIKRSKHLENAKKNNIGLSFEECIERVCIGTNDKKEDFNISGNGKIESHISAQFQEQSCLEKSILMPKEPSQPGVFTSDDALALPTAPRRGRPKGNVSRTCSHCGLLASSITNLTVHIRRKHSHQYSYLCKVCKYYTVTKGDMERHCATKKHKGRVEIEANGKQSSDIIVVPEGSNIEACIKNTPSAVTMSDEQANKSTESDIAVLEKPVVAHVNPTEVEVENVLQAVGSEVHSAVSGKKEQVSLEPEVLLQQGDTCAQKDAAGTSENKCLHCEFSAHSPASLELHVKRKHTKEFEFYCMACDYYAVTRREMTRHAATEKHKMKRQSYLSSSSGEAGSADMAKRRVASEEEHPHSPREFQITPDQSSNTLKPRHASDSVLEDNTNLDVSKVLCASDTVEIEEESSFGEAHSFSETFQQPSAKDQVMKPEEMVSVSISSSYGSPKRLQNENSGSSALNCEAAKINQGVLDSIDKPCVRRESSEGAAGDSEGQHLCPGVLGGKHPTESTSSMMMEIHREQTNLESGGQSTTECARNPEDLKELQENPILPNKEILMDSPGTEIILEEDGPASESTVVSSDVYETIISIDDKGQAMYSFGRFDSSIIRIKNPEDAELVDQPEESLMAMGVRVTELSLKDCAPGLKKKKVEGSSYGESTRIRCDDCGFLADGLSGLNVHIAMKHPTKEKHFHCLLCGKSFYTESNLHQHLASAGHMRNEQASVEELPEGGATFKCVKCTEPFDSEQNLFLHIKGQHEELLREVNKYIVEDTEQINREREENQGSVCKYCGKMCRSSNSMAFLAHIRTHTGSKPFKCKICHFATAQLGDARNHVKRHLGMREYKCHVCGKFTCHLCDRSFTEKWALNNHMKLHTGEKPFKCTWPTCHYSFLTASAMKDHYRTHTGEKSFLCDLCGFAGGTRHALTKHRRQHTGEKPFKCDECNFASTTQSHLTRHKRVHTGEKPYRCPWCDYRSNCAENIRKHILHTGKHEGVKMYNCPKCDYGTNVPVEFRNHLKEQHPDIENPDLAYLHAGIVSKSYECRLKGQGATFVETDSPFTAAALAEESPVREKPRSSRRPAPAPEPLQQLIIIQGYDGELALDASVEETAAATLQTLALAGQLARVVHITEDGQVIATSQGGASAGSEAPAALLPEQLDGATQVVVVGSSVDGHSVEEALGPSGAVTQQVTKQEILSLSEASGSPPEAASALDALLCAVTELGEAEGRDKGRPSPKQVLVQLPHPEDDRPGSEAPQTQTFPDAQEVLAQVTRPSAIIASQERAQVAFKKMVQGVLQLAVCDPAAAGQLLKDGVTQVLVNEEGAVHMVTGEGSQFIMQETEPHGLRLPADRMDLVESEGEISQIIVTEELVQAMVGQAASSFPEGTTHYIVTELPSAGPEDEAVYSHALMEAGSQEILQAEAVAPGGVEQLASMVIYTQDRTPAATVVQSQRESSELREA